MEDLRAYKLQAIENGDRCEVSHLNKDGYPNLIKALNKNPKDDKIRFWLAARRDAWLRCNPNPNHMKNVFRP